MGLPSEQALFLRRIMSDFLGNQVGDDPGKIFTADNSRRLFDIISRVDAGYTHDALFALGRRLKELEARVDGMEKRIA